MPIKKKVYSDVELEWAEAQLASWKQYIDDNPFHKLTDREAKRDTAKGGFVMVTVATIEQQGKYIQDTMKNYLALLSEVEKMREADEQKKLSLRGQEDASPFESGEI